ncbi:MAG: DUF2946 domain-containing protein [Hyphomicrobium sp.]|uniref:DUF2946 domain-containing protein n=1 Tax=Hyphomicrobium sp. TaxID=82 RepID=UPI001321BBB1|nr:DUF2946 domain-containing protein [Hyphomicrobium sp.]KAB2944043.1 MAG: DUF2946 domain-containing protein [Hyphomicrobium sp.]MBZ0209336.1 DUF2946 domain-containing protein [Hyphomicrobium sp.]MCZ7593869.1 DUF2946 domain-containing protein [Hyphomicrobium sp.]
MAAACALVGIALYALLLPWHLVSQFERQLFGAEFGAAAELICSSGTQSGGSPSIPGAPTTSCPICKGLAAFQFALAPAPLVVAAPMPLRSPALLALREDVAGAAALSPRSRGPPSRA